MLQILTLPWNSQPWSVSNEERTGTVGPRRVHLQARGLLGFRVWCLTLCRNSGRRLRVIWASVWPIFTAKTNWVHAVLMVRSIYLRCRNSKRGGDVTYEVTTFHLVSRKSEMGASVAVVSILSHVTQCTMHHKGREMNTLGADIPFPGEVLHHRPNI